MCSLRCSICLEAAKDQQDETGWAVLGCGHVFHSHCLQQSLEHKKACPNCRKNVKSAKGAQPLFLDLVPVMPMTPLTKGGGIDDSNRGFASQEAVTALAETLAKRDAELKQHLLELRQTQESLQEQTQLCNSQEDEIVAIQAEGRKLVKIMEEDLAQKRKQVLTLKQSMDKQSSSHKLRCDKLMGQLSRLQTDYDRLSLRNDLGLTKPELEQIAKRMVPPPAKGGGSVNYWVGAVDARNKEYAQLMRKYQVEANLHDATKRSLSEQLHDKQALQESKSKLQQQVQQMQAKQDQQAAEIAKLQVHQSQAAQPGVTAACEGQSGDRSGAGAGQRPTPLHPHLYREQERSSVDAGPRMASVIRWDVTEDQMLGAMHMAPPPSNPKKSLSLRERMTLHKPSRPHASVCNPDVPREGQCQVAPQDPTPSPQPQTVQLPPSAMDDPPTSAGPGDHAFPPTHEAGNQAEGALQSATTRPGQPEECGRPDVVQAHDALPGDGGSDDDMTQEDMPTEPVPAHVELPDLGETSQPLHQQPSSQQSKSFQQAPSESGSRQPQATPGDPRQPQARREGSAKLHQHAVEGDCADEDDEARWEQALEAEMQGLSNRADEHVSGRGCSDADVMQLDVESADDLLDVLADAAAETSPARVEQDQATSEADDKHSRITAAAKAVAMQRTGAPTKSESIHPLPTSRPGLQQRARQEPSFARSASSFGNRGPPGGEFIVRGADGRGGRATVLKPHNRPAASAQPVPSFIATGATKNSKLPAKRKASAGLGNENLKIKHFFAPSR